MFTCTYIIIKKAHILLFKIYLTNCQLYHKIKKVTKNSILQHIWRLIKSIGSEIDWIFISLTLFIDWIINWKYISLKARSLWKSDFLKSVHIIQKTNLQHRSIRLCPRKRSLYVFDIFFELIDTISSCIVSLETLYKHHILFYDKMLYLSLFFLSSLCIYF